jgi:hypothetical protein
MSDVTEVAGEGLEGSNGTPNGWIWHPDALALALGWHSPLSSHTVHELTSIVQT